MNRTFLATLLFFLPLLLTAQHRLLVAGNTADAEPGFYAALESGIRNENTPATVLFAGDFLSDCPPDFSTLAPLTDLIVRNPETDFYLIPGDRDWDKSGKGGLACVKALEDHLRGQGLKNLHWPLRNGCPGPETVELTPHLRLLLLNTQWWNHPHDKPVPADGNCDFADPSIAYDEILSAIEENQDQNVIIAGHFPPKSQGRRGGKAPVRDHFVPPVIGSFRVSYRQNVGTPEELTNARFDKLGSKLSDYNGQFEGLIFVGAQDESQQLLKYGRNYIVNAGAAGPGRWVAGHKPAIHTSREPGFTELTFGADGAVKYRYGKVAHLLYQAPCGERNDSLPDNPAFPPCGIDSLAMMDYPVYQEATVTVAAGPQYERSRFGELFLGQHYRDTWTAPVEAPVLNLSSFPGALTPIREGGGRQTTSLKLQSGNGEEYVFRSVDKDPAGTFDYQIRNTIIADAVRDQTSTGHPYGGLIVAPLLENIGILHATPSLYSLSPGPALGNFNPKFGGLLGTLEVNPKRGTFGSTDVVKSFELFRMRYDDQEVRVEFKEFLRARLFDLWIGDWSKHEDNWKWATYEVDDLVYVRPIPRDRDNAFSLMDGLFPWLAARRWAVPNLEHFGDGEPDIRSLTYQARHMDRLLLSGLERADFLREAAAIQTAMTDSVIRAAVATMPAPAFAESGERLIERLILRRNELLTYAEDYYLLHARTVDVVGTNDEETFRVNHQPDGSLIVTVTDKKGKSAGQLLYQRTFLPAETKEVQLYGLGDDDDFVLTGSRPGPIRVKLIGGDGTDGVTSELTGRGGRPALLFDEGAGATPERVPGLRRARNPREESFYYDRTRFKYNTLVPTAGIGYNSYTGGQFGLGATYTRYGYDRQDFVSRYYVYAESSTIGNAALEARAEFGEVIRWVDLVLNGRLGRPDFYNFFFGLGNDSTYDPDLDRNTFNLVQLQHFSVSGGLRRRFAGRSYVNLFGGYQNNRTTQTEGTILDREDRLYGDGDLVFGYVKPEVVLDLRDHPVFPSKGILFEASHKQAIGLGTESFGISKVAAEIHLSTRRFPISLSFRTGYATSQGRAPFYELPSLGRQNGLRGFQRNRFVGEGYIFYNTEFRSPVALVRSRIAPFAIGIRAFYDRGKILEGRDDLVGMHDAYGGGIYIIPLSRSFTVSALAGFSEEESFLLQFGLGTNF